MDVSFLTQVIERLWAMLTSMSVYILAIIGTMRKYFKSAAIRNKQFTALSESYKV